MLNKKFKDLFIKRGKTLITLLILLSLILSVIPLTQSVAADSSDTVQIWDGSSKAPSKGSGTEDDPYEISNGSELYYVISNGGGNEIYYEFTQDIYLNDITKINLETGEVAEGYNVNWWPYNAPFCGNVEGNGHVVYGLYYNEAVSPYFGYHGIGLFPRVNVGTTLTVHGLGVDSSFIKGKNGASAFVGAAGVTSNKTSTEVATVNISECFVGSSVTVSGADAGAFRGLGRYSALTLENSYSAATLIGAERYGLFSNVWDSSVNMKNSFNATGPVSSDVKSSKVTLNGVYDNKAGNYTDSVTLTFANMQGKDVFTNSAKMPLLNSDEKFTATQGLPVLTLFGVPEDEKPAIEISKHWDGSTTTAPVSGEGTKDSPFSITCAAELAYVVKNGGEGKYYVLENDIYLNDLDKINWTTGVGAENYQINVWFNNLSFSGNIDGNGHTVYGLYSNDTTGADFGYTGVGLIPRVNRGDSVTLTALGVDYAYIAGKYGASALVGFAGGKYYNESTGRATVIVDQCYVGEDVFLSGHDIGAFRGGSYFSDTYISNSYSLATQISPGNYGLVGNMWEAGAVISNSFNANGKLTTEVKLSAMLFVNSYGTEACNYTDGAYLLSKENMQGEDALTSPDKMPLLNSASVFTATSAYPVLSVFSGKDIASVTEKPGDVWTGTLSIDFSRGSGSEADPYIIDTAAALAYVIKAGGFGGKYFKLTHDIYLNDITSKTWYLNTDNREWVVTNGFRGHIDGDGHIVYGLWFPDGTTLDNAGLISTFAFGSIKNLGVKNAQVNALHYAGGIVGATSNGGQKVIDSCFTDETVYVTAYDKNCGVGGIVGMAYDMSNSENVSLTITNCYSKARFTAPDSKRTNGILGSSWRTPYSIKGCYSVGYPVFTAEGGGMVTSAVWNFVPNGKDEWRNGKVIADYICNNYSDTFALTNGVYAECTPEIVIENSSDMRGESAATFMPNLDYAGFFETVLGGTPKLKIFTSISGEDIYSNKEADFFGEGIGTQTDPFIISTVEHLRYVVESLDTKGKYYKLGNDIYVNNTKDPDWTEKSPALWYSTWDHNSGFAGHLDGDGYAIYGLYYNETPNPTPEQEAAFYVQHGTGLFPYIDASASVRNLHIRDSFISGKGCVGAIAGGILTGVSGERLTLIACSVDESVTLHGYTVGGLVGAGNKPIDLTYCYSTANLSSSGAKNRLNGLIGDNWSGNVSMLQCYAVGHPLMFGAFTATEAIYTTVKDTAATYLSKNKMIGAAAKKNMTDFSWNTVWYAEEGKTPQLKVVPYGAEEHFYDEGVKGRVWSGKIATKFAGGSGTALDPYIIETPEQLALLVTRGNDNSNTHYKLIADIMLNDTSDKNWKKDAKPWFAGMTLFRGQFDGNGHVVSGLYYKNTAKTDSDAVGIFQRLGSDSTIKRLGVINAEVTSIGKGITTFAGGIAGWLEHWQSAKNPDKNAPVISECFADDTVKIEASVAGGLLGGGPDRVDFENCYFTGTVVGDTYGALIGSAWGEIGPHFTNCYGATPDRDLIGGGWTITSNDKTVVYKNCYVDGRTYSPEASMLSVMYMRGDTAKQYMSGFDFSKVWQTVEKGSPVLRCFENPEKYSCKRDPSMVEISFATMGGEKCESIKGIPGYTKLTKDDLPVPVYYGYKFNGWYHHNSYGAPFELDTFPNYDITLYAQWEQTGFLVNFEDAVDETYDINAGVEVFKPGVARYNPKYIYGGYRALRTVPDAGVDPIFLLSYKNKLEVGKEYEMTVHITTDSDVASGKVMLLYTNHPDANAQILGEQKGFEFSDLSKAEWQEFKFKFTASSPYLLIKTSAGASLYFDDIQIVPTGNEGEVQIFASPEPPKPVLDIPEQPIMPIVIVSITALIIAVLLATIIILKARKRKTAK